MEFGSFPSETCPINLEEKEWWHQGRTQNRELVYAMAFLDLVRLADHGLDTASCNNSRLGVILLFLFVSKQPQVVCSKSQSVSGFGIMKFAPENSLLIDGNRLGSASESPLIRLS